MVRQLPIIRFQGKLYFVDKRLEEIRNIYNPHDRLSFRMRWEMVRSESRE